MAKEGEKKKEGKKRSISKAKGDEIKEFFPIVTHRFSAPSEKELHFVNTFSNATFEKRIQGFKELIDFRKRHPNDAFILVSNHLSETDFIEVMLYFLNHKQRLLIQGGDNLFMNDVKVNADYMKMTFNLDTYLRSRGAFQIIRKPKSVRFKNELLGLSIKDVVKLNTAYLFHLIRQGEMILQYPGQSIVDKQPKMGRSYTGSTDSFSPAMFQLLVETASICHNDIFITPVNISYESILEDANFRELLKLKEGNYSEETIYKNDIEHVLHEYINPNRKTRYCLKFGVPEPLEIEHFWAKYGLGKKATAKNLAADFFGRVMAMHTPFPSNIFFMAAKGQKEVEIKYLEDKIPLIMEILDLKQADMHYLKVGDDYTHPSYIIESALNRFAPRRIISKQGGQILIYREDVAQQYANHIAHFFK